MPNTRIVELRLRELSQLFDPLDPSSPDERDLNHRVEEFIVESLKEVFANEVRELIVHFDQPATMPDEERIVVNAIRAHFARRAKYFQLSLHKLIRRGLISLGIGLAFLGVFFLTGRILVHLMGENAFTTVLTESLIIVAGSRCGGRSKSFFTTGGRFSANDGSTIGSVASRCGLIMTSQDKLVGRHEFCIRSTIRILTPVLA